MSTTEVIFVAALIGAFATFAIVLGAIDFRTGRLGK